MRQLLARRGQGREKFKERGCACVKGAGRAQLRWTRGCGGERAWEPEAQEGHTEGHAFSFSCHKRALQSVSRRDRIRFVVGEAPVGCCL